MQTIFTRFMLIVAIFILWIGGITVRLVSLQINQSEWLTRKGAKSKTRSDKKQNASRHDL